MLPFFAFCILLFAVYGLPFREYALPFFLWRRGLRSSGPVVFGSSGPLVLCFCGALILWSSRLVVFGPCSSARLALWSGSLLVPYPLSSGPPGYPGGLTSGPLILPWSSGLVLSPSLTPIQCRSSLITVASGSFRVEFRGRCTRHRFEMLRTPRGSSIPRRIQLPQALPRAKQTMSFHPILHDNLTPRPHDAFLSGRPSKHPSTRPSVRPSVRQIFHDDITPYYADTDLLSDHDHAVLLPDTPRRPSITPNHHNHHTNRLQHHHHVILFNHHLR